MNKKTGIIEIKKESTTITFERHLPHPIERIWKAITNPEQRAAWFGRTTIEPKEGGTIETIAEGPPASEDVRRNTGKIRVWDPPKVFEYEEEASNIGHTIIRFELTSEGEGDTTFLCLINSRLSISDARGYAPGWHAFLDRLESYLDRAPLPDWGIRYGKDG